MFLLLNVLVGMVGTPHLEEYGYTQKMFVKQAGCMVGSEESRVGLHKVGPTSYKWGKITLLIGGEMTPVTLIQAHL